jgi:hypothetical protein
MHTSIGKNCIKRYQCNKIGKLYRCPFRHCNYINANNSSLNKHRESVHKPHYRICSYCNKVFSKNKIKEAHVTNAHKYTYCFKCDNFIFGSLNTIISHNKRIHENKLGLHNFVQILDLLII